MSIKSKIVNALGLALIALTLQSCALMKDHIDVGYSSMTPCTVIEGAQQQNVKITVFDKRIRKDRVGRKMNGYGIEMAPILAKNDVADVLQQAITMELQGRGFNVGPGQKDLLIFLNKFNNDFKPGFCGSSCVAEAMLNVQLKNREGRILYANSIIGHGGNDWLLLYSGKNAKVALDSALQDAVYQLVNDQAFLDALMQ